MRATGRATQWRALGLLALLVGLLGMHGLVGAQHHAPSAAAHPPASAPIQRIGHAVAAAGNTIHEALAVTGDRLAPGCHDGCSEPPLAALCLAVLTSVAFGLLAAARMRARRAQFVVAFPQAWTVRAPPPLRFDLVADLCVSRT